MGCRLRAVHQYRHAASVGSRDQLGDRIDGTERVGEVHYGNEPGPIGEQSIEGVLIELTRVADGYRLELCSYPTAHQLPRYDVRVVLHAGDQHLVAWLQHAGAVALGHEVDGLGGPTGED